MGKNVIISTLPNISQNYLPKVNTSNIFANSLVYDDGSSVLINTTTASAFRLDVNGTGRFQGALTGTSATFTLANDITLTARSGAAGSYTYWSLGRTSSELELGVAAAANQFFTGTAAGDVVIKANGSSNKLMLGYGSGSPTLTLASTGAATFSSSVSVGSAIAGRLGVRGTTNDSSAYSFEAANSSGNTLFIVRNDGLSWFTGNVGIGTTSPQGKLDITGGSGDLLYLDGGVNTDYAFKIVSGADDMLTLRRQHTTQGNKDIISFGYSGNVGIGTTTPSNTALHIVADWVSGNSTVKVQPSTGTTSGYGVYDNTGARKGIFYREAGYVAIETNSEPLLLNTNGIERMRITSEGYLGTTVTGTTVSAGDLLGVLAFVSRDSSTYSSGGIANIRSYATTTYNTGNVSGDLRFYVSDGLQNITGSYLFGTEAMRITSGGQVRVGTSTSNLGGNVIFSAGSSGAFGIIASAQGTGTYDTGISINQGSAGQAIILLVSRHTDAGTATSAAIYLIKCYFDGNNTPAMTFIGGDNFVTIGKSGSNTITLTTSGSAQVQYTLMGNK